MQLTCPSCGSRYRIDASTWPTEPGPEGGVVLRPRKARCKVCRDVWQALPEEEALELDNPLPPEEGPRPAAWASVSGWPEPRAVEPALHMPPPVFASPMVLTPQPLPPLVQSAIPASVLQAPADPPFTFQRPPGMGADRPSPMQSNGRGRLPGPGSFGDDEPADDDDDRPLPPTEPWHEDEEAEDPAPRRWPWIAAGLLILVLAAAVLLATGRVRPETFGLPAVNLTVVELPDWADPAQIGLPPVTLPQVAVPRTAPPPLAIKADAVKRRLAGNRTVWEVRGTVTNPTRSRHAVPPVELLLIDGANQVVGRWTVRPELERLAPGGVTRFETSAIDPPREAVRVRLQLKPGDLGRL